MCIETCGRLTPPGCDCFSCCTICDQTRCYDIATGLADAACDLDTLADADLCPRCTKTEECGSECGGETCVLCPGQTAEDLPASCEVAECPAGSAPCADNGDCGSEHFCSLGCCIDTVD